MPGGRECCTSCSFAFTPSMTLSAFSPKRRTTIPPTPSPFPRTPPLARPERCSARVRPQRYALNIRQGREVAPPPDHVFTPGEFQQASLDVVVAHLDRLDDVLHAEVVGRQLVRIDVDLVLLHESADARHLGDTRHR